MTVVVVDNFIYFIHLRNEALKLIKLINVGKQSLLHLFYGVHVAANVNYLFKLQQ